MAEEGEEGFVGEEVFLEDSIYRFSGEEGSHHGIDEGTFGAFSASELVGCELGAGEVEVSVTGGEGMKILGVFAEFLDDTEFISLA